MDDDVLIAAVAAGDPGALHELFSRNAPWLAVRLRRVLPVDVVEDVLQETFIAVWDGASGYRPEGRAGAWLWGIGRRQAALWIRKHGRPWIGAASAAAEDPEALAIAKVELDEALSTLGAAGSPERELWQLLFVEDRSVADVAGQLRIPEGTVKSRANRVRRLMRTALRQGVL